MSIKRLKMLSMQSTIIEIDSLNPDTESLYLTTVPSLKILRLLVDKCTNLKSITVPDFVYISLIKKESHLKVISGIALIRNKINHTRYTHSRGIGPEKVSSRYQVDREFLLSMPEEKKKDFQELLDFGIKPALFTKRFFCLEGEEKISLNDLARLFKLNVRPPYMSLMIESVLNYLGVPLDIYDDLELQTQRVKRRLALYRRRFPSKKWEKEFNQRFGITAPKGVRPDLRILVESVATILEENSNNLKSYRKRFKDNYQMVIDRCGLGISLEFMTLQEVGNKYGVTRERVRQAQEHFLSNLTRKV